MTLKLVSFVTTTRSLHNTDYNFDAVVAVAVVEVTIAAKGHQSEQEEAVDIFVRLAKVCPDETTGTVTTTARCRHRIDFVSMKCESTSVAASPNSENVVRIHSTSIPRRHLGLPVRQRHVRVHLSQRCDAK